MLNSVPFRATSSQMISTIRNGLPKTKTPKTIIIVGAGMAGLVSASLLKEAGHHVKIIEATGRIGGRVHTLRSPFSKGLYLDAGAMRIPQFHQLTMEYIRNFDLPVNQFFNTTPNDIVFVNGVKTRLKYYRNRPEILRYPVIQQEKGKTAGDLLRMAIQPLIDYFQKYPQHVDSIITPLDRYSMMDFLRYNPFHINLSQGAIDMIQVMLNINSLSEYSFLEVCLDDIMPIFLHPNLPFYEITGGNDLLPHAFLPQLADDIHLRQKVMKIVQQSDKVSIHTEHTKTREPLEFTGDAAIVTVPFSMLQLIDVEPYDAFSYGKRRAIHELHYGEATKVGIEFKHRFWEEVGNWKKGKIISDLPIRFTYFPSHGIGESGPAVLLASYTWENDAMVWNSLSDEGCIRKALDDLAEIYGRRVYQEFVTGVSFSWLQNEHFGGAFTLYKPGQKTRLTGAIRSQEGRVHIAGEHASDHPGWIEGAIESAIQVAYGVNDLANIGAKGSIF